MSMQRRDFLKAAGASATVGTLAACATQAPAPTIAAPEIAKKAKPKVVVVGGGFGGATAAKYVAKFGGGDVDVTLVERGDAFISCPLSNLIVGGSRQLADLAVPYTGLDKYGITRVKGEATRIDPGKRFLILADGKQIPYDRLILSPGVDFMYDDLAGLRSAEAQSKILHAWKAGLETVALRKQLEAMPDGGVFAMHIPKAPYRCPPGPYERACQVAWYFKNNKPKSKVIVLDGNEDIVSKKGLFTKAWNDNYKGIVEYRNNQTLLDVDVKTLTAKLEFGDVKADVLNVLPPMRAGQIARIFGMANANARWCNVDFLTYESTAIGNIHIIGDAIQIAPGMPKSGHMANQHAKVCAAAVVDLLMNRRVNQTPMVANTCYSFVDDKNVVHVASVHEYDAKDRTMKTIAGSGGLSAEANALEGAYANAWANTIWADMLA
jgi:sulfide dehydrogenase [flavocytochrome c] flavoprotein chain